MPSPKLHQLRSCPECGRNPTQVVISKVAKDGRIMRRRWCKSCGHRWYTVQPPEQVVESWQISYEGGSNFLDGQYPVIHDKLGTHNV